MSAATRSRWRASSPAPRQGSRSSIRSRFPARAHLGQAGTDEWSAAVLTFENGIVAQVSCAVFVELDNMLRIHGATGRIEVPDFWFAGGTRDQGLGRIDVIPRGGKRRDDQRERDAAPLFLRDRRRGRGDPRRPAGILPARHDLGRQPRQRPRARSMARRGRPRIRDREAGAPQAARSPGRKLKAGTAIARRSLRRTVEEALARRAGLRGFPHILVRARSCSTPSSRRAATLFDTAFVYGAGYTEKLFGDWHSSRGVREAVGADRQGRAHAALLPRR